MDFLFIYSDKKIVSEQIVNKKAFQLNANHPLVNSLRFIVNKFEHVWGAGGGGGAQALYRGRGIGQQDLYRRGVGALYRDPPRRE